MRIDHVAIPSRDIAATTRWYRERFGAEVLYEDASWAFLKVGGSKIALVTPGQHPPHIAFAVTAEELEREAGKHGAGIESHRDGTRGIYLSDPAGNAVELICYPAGYLGESRSSVRVADIEAE
jgi:catechol 2,3-dioxygenase-like lactoylglutathione lyase family enzyme